MKEEFSLKNSETNIGPEEEEKKELLKSQIKLREEELQRLQKEKEPLEERMQALVEIEKQKGKWSDEEYEEYCKLGDRKQQIEDQIVDVAGIIDELTEETLSD